MAQTPKHLQTIPKIEYTQGVRWNPIGQWFEPQSRMEALNESLPYWRALDKVHLLRSTRSIAVLLQGGLFKGDDFDLSCVCLLKRDAVFFPFFFSIRPAFAC